MYILINPYLHTTLQTSDMDYLACMHRYVHTPPIQDVRPVLLDRYFGTSAKSGPTPGLLSNSQPLPSASCKKVTPSASRSSRDTF